MKIMLLGSGELGREFSLAVQKFGHEVVAVDRYENAPAMQVSQHNDIIDMLDAEMLDAVVAKHKPDIIVPEIEAIRTERFYDYEKQGITVVPSAKAANFTMNRQAIRDLAAKELGLRTAKYEYASNMLELQKAIMKIRLPCVIKPLVSSSGKGQSVIKSERDIAIAWAAASKGRGDSNTVIVEEFINFNFEITLLTVTQKNAETLFCPPIGHRQDRGDYQESWIPENNITAEQLAEAQDMAQKVTAALGGFGIWGVEFFVGKDGFVYFSELSPRPHDTGLVTLAPALSYSQFELHARAILGQPIESSLDCKFNAASAVVLAEKNIQQPQYVGLEKIESMHNVQLHIFNKPTAHLYRRMAVVTTHDNMEMDMKKLRDRATTAASKIKIKEGKSK